MDQSEVTLLYRVRKTVLQMLKDRSYIVSDKKLNQTLDEFKASYNGSRDSLNLLVERRAQHDAEGNVIVSDEAQRLIVFFPDQDKLNMQALKQIALKMIEINCFNSVVVIKGATQISRRELDELKPCEIECFLQQELLVNITEHELVPKHEVLSDQAKHELLKKYRVRDSQLPKIQVEDPIARYYGVKRGQVMKIVRASETAGRYVTYRLAY
ncbi:polymerase ii (dna directed) polypeptide e [Stylonychia lemnae]|uniref:Polymerase ii (Dna directed) polypeptide e n=1 Tax=Stylonychia lemnae TaxID=5949 RepID=A0A078AHE5_STYLE|nr:polymerase ii (dna directed) polypeptide e [Stylonychia lemnae]|eukprot:CDW81674.1 polymerase ii (dna directed) polypeptide e [Stylonychia lemnae]